MEEFEIEIFEDEDEFDEDDERLAEIYRLFIKLMDHLESIKSLELREATALMMIRELIDDDRILAGLATKMLQDLTLGFEDDPTYTS